MKDLVYVNKTTGETVTVNVTLTEDCKMVMHVDNGKGEIAAMTLTELEKNFKKM